MTAQNLTTWPLIVRKAIAESVSPFKSLVADDADRNLDPDRDRAHFF